MWFKKVMLGMLGFFMLFFFFFQSFTTFSISKIASTDYVSCLLLFLLAVVLMYMTFFCVKKLTNFEILSLGFVCIGFFFSAKMISFYIFFELAVMPMMFLILKYGLKPERLEASSYMLVYTIVGGLSFLFKLGLWSLFLNLGIFVKKLVWCFGVGLGAMWALAFLVKVPMYGVHSWLPKAHVEASGEGSVFLAAIMLKFGSYGLYRMSWLVSLKSLCFSWVFFWVFMTSFVCLVTTFRASDYKGLIAFSSMVHMIFVILVLLSFMGVSNEGMLMMLVVHGLVSSALFMNFSYVYFVTGTRSVNSKVSFLKFSPLLVMFWFVWCMFNSSVPPSFSLVSELLMFSVGVKFSVWVMFLVGMIIFFTGLYKIYLYINLSHGKNNSHSKSSLALYFGYYLGNILFFFFMMLFLVSLDILF